MRRAALLFLLCLSACGKSETEQLKEENEELHAQVDQLQSKLAEIKEKSDNLETASDHLQQQLGRFEAENWRDVMPDAKAAGNDVDEAKDDLKDSVDR
jgi:predicted nuclease with TOPRIM domain